MSPPVKALAKRRELVAQAAELFDREGYHATNVGRIAEAVGIRKPTLYHYVSSKDEILTWIHEEFIDLLHEKLAARPDDLPAPEQLAAVMTDVLELMETHRGHVRVFFEHHRELPAEARTAIRDKRDAYQVVVEETIKRGIASGDLRAVDCRLASLAFFGMCNWAYQWFRADGSLRAREIADLFVDLFLHGVAAPAR